MYLIIRFVEKVHNMERNICQIFNKAIRVVIFIASRVCERTPYTVLFSNLSQEIVCRERKIGHLQPKKTSQSFLLRSSSYQNFQMISGTAFIHLKHTAIS